jgi:Tfp pilus assembly protein PilF
MITAVLVQVEIHEVPHKLLRRPAMAKTLRTIPADEFARRLFQITKPPDKRFALFLGAGCSVSSGIPSAGSLVKDSWLPRLRDFCAPARKDLDDWAKEILPNYDTANPAASYGDLMDKLFLLPEERQREVESLCDGRFPSFGYACLAQLMEMDGGRFNVALTSNFDDLIPDALYLFTQSRPLVIHHESLASFIRPTRTRPLVVKLHGDHRLTPQNTRQETEVLKEEIEKQVRSILHDRGLIFVGYGGNDQGIAKMLESLPAEALPLGVFWVNGKEPDCAIRPWLEARDAFWIEKSDFDELMLLIRDVFGLAHPERRRFDDVFEKYKSTYEKLSGSVLSLPDTAPDAEQLKIAVKRADASLPESLRYLVLAQRLQKTAPDKAGDIYLASVNQFPDSPPLLGAYATFLTDIRKENDRAEEFYRRAIDADPKHANNLGCYAVFLSEARKDHDRAEEFFRRAIDADPRHATNLGNYAIFLTNVRKDFEGAEEFYRLAIAADPKQANNLGAYALFLHANRGDHSRAEEFYRDAINANPKHALNLNNYANFLNNVREDHDLAEEFYHRAIDADPKQAGILGNYAFFLHMIRKDYDRAGEFYRRAIDADPKHASNLGNYANFLTDIRKDHDQAEDFYRRAVDADPKEPATLGNYANFLNFIRKDHDRAEEFYCRAIAADPKHPNNLGNYGVFLANIRKDYDRAEEFYRRSLEADPSHANSCANQAGFVLARGRNKEGLDLVEKFLRRQEASGVNAAATECWFYAFAHRPAQTRSEALTNLKKALLKGARSPGWNFSANIARAREENHPDVEWLEKLAAVISDGADLATLDAWPDWAAAGKTP